MYLHDVPACRIPYLGDLLASYPEWGRDVGCSGLRDGIAALFQIGEETPDEAAGGVFNAFEEKEGDEQEDQGGEGHAQEVRGGVEADEDVIQGKVDPGFDGHLHEIDGVADAAAEDHEAGGEEAREQGALSGEAEDEQGEGSDD